MIVVDTNFLIFMIDPASTQDKNGRSQRIQHFLQQLPKNTVITVPAPSLAEFVAGRAQRVEEMVEIIRRQRGFIVQAFDEVIAIETGERIAQVVDKIPDNQKLPGWRVAMKYDAMIAATAIVRGASELYTGDTGLGKYLEGSTVELRMIDDLPMPPEDAQRKLPL
ncbi:type II toxin-antitoxin system VapC family toxin [Rhizobium tumorigenes]|uniref:type II toxin-antitoxin system VapC family toxin n=1 Tax=Rhizobium tumorigenes TaxID=2041385 RepID=UPI00241E8E87|nr:type II toxin-antitoxin system VapC family toxin [Rhizobium tumorigenes]WFS01741.1 type II toxin-antitoxin system VapC family toxin [Rhizobium tumorigenes]